MSLANCLETLQRSIIYIYIFCLNRNNIDINIKNVVFQLKNLVVDLGKFSKESYCFEYEKKHIESICEALKCFKENEYLLNHFQSKLLIHDYFSFLICYLSSIKISLRVYSGFDQ